MCPATRGWCPVAKPHGSVRIGPISLFTLIIILCLAVLAVLSLTTARAELSVTERQAQTTTETYALETAGQEFVAAVDAALAEGASSALGEVLSSYGVTEGAADGEAAAGAETGAGEASSASGETIEDEGISGATVDEGGSLMVIECPAGDPVTVTGSFDGSLITATFSLDSGRTLAAALRINDNGSYTIEQWKMTTQWTDDGTGENLWLG